MAFFFRVSGSSDVCRKANKGLCSRRQERQTGTSIRHRAPVTFNAAACLVAFLYTTVGSHSVSAQTLIMQYAPESVAPGAGAPATAIPTLGGIGLILLSLLLAGVVSRMNRDGRFPHRPLAFLAIISAALVSGLDGVKLISEAVAQNLADDGAGQQIPEFKDMTNSAGGSLTFLDGVSGGETACVRNATDVPQHIISMQAGLNGFTVAADPECDFADFDQVPEPRCEVGLILAPGDICGASTVNFTASDMRLKTDVQPAGWHESGLALYEFRYLGGSTRYRGVMAQEVLSHTPAAVVVMRDGYLAVNYGMLGLEMTVVQ